MQNYDKCAKELLNQILPELKNWIPAKKEDKNIIAQSSFLFYPDDLFEKYQNGYNANNLLISAQFIEENGKNFSQNFLNCLDFSSYNVGKEFNFTLFYTIDKEGNVKNIYTDTEFFNADFDKMIENCIIGYKIKWKPATFRGIPVNQTFIFKVNLKFKGISVITPFA